MRTAAATAGLAAFGMGSASATNTDETAETITFSEDFGELGAEWMYKTDLSDPYVSGMWDASLIDPAGMDSQLVEFVADGFATPGMVWIYAPIEVESGTAYEGKVTAEMYNPVTMGHDTRLHVTLAPELPDSHDQFPDPYESWQLEGDRLGMNVSLADKEGWNEYSTYWSSPELETDTLYLAIGISTDAYTTMYHYLDSVDVELTPAGADDGGDTVSDTSLETFSEPRDRNVSFNSDSGTVTIQDTITAPTPCHSLGVAKTSCGDDTLEINLTLDEGDQTCIQQVEEIGYEMTVSCHSMPDSVTVTAQGNDVLSATTKPVVDTVEFFMGNEALDAHEDAELVDESGSWSAGTHYDASNNVVHIADTVKLTNGCQYPVLAGSTVDSDADRFEVDIDIESEGDSCTQQIREVPIHVKASFENGLPGDVEYNIPEQ